MVSPTGGSSFYLRLRTAFIGIPIVGGVISTIPSSSVLLAIIMVISLREYQVLVDGIVQAVSKGRKKINKGFQAEFMTILGLLLLIGVYIESKKQFLHQAPLIYLASIVTAIMDLYIFLSSHQKLKQGGRELDPTDLLETLVKLILHALGMIVIIQGILYLFLLRRCSLTLTIIFVASCWNTDNGALLFGTLGGPADPVAHWLLPIDYQRGILHVISPKKTVTGVAGGILLGVVTHVLLVKYLLPEEVKLGRLLCQSLFLSILAQSGDLLESFLKRTARVKDSGGVLPGHGGLLDRIDSLLLGVPFFYYFYCSNTIT